MAPRHSRSRPLAAVLLVAALSLGGCTSDPHAFSSGGNGDSMGGYPILASNQTPVRDTPTVALLLLALPLVILDAMLQDAAEDHNLHNSPPGYYPQLPNHP